MICNRARGKNIAWKERTREISVFGKGKRLENENQVICK